MGKNARHALEQYYMRTPCVNLIEKAIMKTMQ